MSARAKRRPARGAAVWLLALALLDAVLIVQTYRTGGWAPVALGALLVALLLVLDGRRSRRRPAQSRSRRR